LDFLWITLCHNPEDHAHKFKMFYIEEFRDHCCFLYIRKFHNTVNFTTALVPRCPVLECLAPPTRSLVVFTEEVNSYMMGRDHYVILHNSQFQHEFESLCRLQMCSDALRSLYMKQHMRIEDYDALNMQLDRGTQRLHK
jgi:hypothetical protein